MSRSSLPSATDPNTDDGPYERWLAYTAEFARDAIRESLNPGKRGVYHAYPQGPGLKTLTTPPLLSDEAVIQICGEWNLPSPFGGGQGWDWDGQDLERDDV